MTLGAATKSSSKAFLPIRMASILRTGITEVFVPKGLQDSARGFNPGNAQETTRPEWAAGSFDQRLVWLASYIPETPLLQPLRGGAVFYRHLGLEPQAES